MSAGTRRRGRNPLQRLWRSGWPGALALVMLACAMLTPIAWMLTTSFQAGEKMFQLKTEWIPSPWHPENFPNALSRAPFAQFFFNSGVVSLIVMASNLVFCTLAATDWPSSAFPASASCWWPS